MLPLLIGLAIAIQRTGRVVLPPGIVDVATELKIGLGVHDLVIVGNPKGTVLRLTSGFKGRAAIVCEKAVNLRLVGFTIDGRRADIPDRAELPPSNVRFADFINRNGI